MLLSIYPKQWLPGWTLPFVSVGWVSIPSGLTRHSTPFLSSRRCCCTPSASSPPLPLWICPYLRLLHVLCVHFNFPLFQKYLLMLARWMNSLTLYCPHLFNARTALVNPGMSYGPTPDLLIWDIAAYTVGGRWFKPQAPYVEPGMCFVPYEGHSGRCVSVSYAPYTTAMPCQVGRLGGKGRSLRSLQRTLTTSQEPCQLPQQMLRRKLHEGSRSGCLWGSVWLWGFAACRYQQRCREFSWELPEPRGQLNSFWIMVEWLDCLHSPFARHALSTDGGLTQDKRSCISSWRKGEWSLWNGDKGSNQKLWER